MSRARELADSYTDNEVDSKPTGFKNHIINGGFDVWQRGTSFSTIGYTADRWNMVVLNGCTVYSSTSGATVDGTTTNILRITNSTGLSQDVVLRQPIEAGILQGREVTFSAEVRGLGAEVSTVYNRTRGTTNDHINLNVPATILNPGFTRLTGTATVPLNSAYTSVYKHDIDINVTIPNGVSFDIAQVQLEEGSVATPFEQRPYGLELSLCQRYYEVITVEDNSYLGQYSSAANIFFGSTLHYSVTKRVGPSVIYSYISGTQYWVIAGQQPFSESTSANIQLSATQDSVRLRQTRTAGGSSTPTSGNLYLFEPTFKLLVSAEL